jgi:hypothetical protein
VTSGSKSPGEITAEEIKRAFRDNLHFGLGRLERFATKNDLYLTLAETAMAERVGQAASDLCETGKTIFAP